jgi:hypothetical protein
MSSSMVLAGHLHHLDDGNDGAEVKARKKEE